MSWFKRENPLQAVVDAQRETIEYLIKEVDYFRERAEKATDNLLALQQKPAITKPNEEAAAAFLDKNLSFFRDEDGGEEVA